MGFDARSHLNTPKILRFSEDPPIVAEIVDSREKINSDYCQDRADQSVSTGLKSERRSLMSAARTDSKVSTHYFISEGRSSLSILNL